MFGASHVIRNWPTVVVAAIATLRHGPGRQPGVTVFASQPDTPSGPSERTRIEREPNAVENGQVYVTEVGAA